MNDDEFLNDRDCTPKGETPRTNAKHADLVRRSVGHQWIVGTAYVEMHNHARELERELCRYEIAYARAMKVLGMAKVAMEWGDQMPAGLNLAIKEWEAGR